MLDLKISRRRWQFFFLFGNGNGEIKKRPNIRNDMIPEMAPTKKNLSQQLFVVFGWSLFFHFLSLAHVVDLNCMKIASRWLRSCIAMHFRQPKKENKKESIRGKMEKDGDRENERKPECISIKWCTGRTFVEASRGIMLLHRSYSSLEHWPLSRKHLFRAIFRCHNHPDGE